TCASVGQRSECRGRGVQGRSNRNAVRGAFAADGASATRRTSKLETQGGTMEIRKPTFALVLAAAAALSIAPLIATDIGGENIRLSGCLVRGGTGGYLLPNGSNQPSGQRADHSVTPGAVGTTGSVATIFYWLRDDDDLKPHVGHR